ncbi:MAG: DUF106 domain-containing protein [Candidatus Aenigmarchaeota archaeon]|nr:DUF106 domain-containing protein [Candidatus Aenigmarchaeota archaeon]
MTGITPFMGITLVSLGLSLLIAVIYRVLTKPDEVRKAKDDMKFYKNKMSEAQKAGDKQKANEYASEMMKASQLQMRHSMKPMMATMVLFLFLLGWLNGNYGGVNADFGENPDAEFAYAGTEHDLNYQAHVEDGASFTIGVDFDDDGQFSQDETFDKGEVFSYEGAFWRVNPATEGFLMFATEKPEAVHFEMLVARLPFELPFLGSYLTWFWWYIFLSIPGTMVFRKLLGVE